MYDKSSIMTDESEFEFISLIAGSQSFCMELDRVREIRRWEPITMLPHSPTYVLGVVNLRGAVVPIVDLAHKLGFEEISPTSRSVIIISNFEKQVIGFLVDSVSEILTIGTSEIKETPGLGSASEYSFIQGVITIGEEMVRLIDINVLMERDDIDA